MIYSYIFFNLPGYCNLSSEGGLEKEKSFLLTGIDSVLVGYLSLSIIFSAFKSFSFLFSCSSFDGFVFSKEAKSKPKCF